MAKIADDMLREEVKSRNIDKTGKSNLLAIANMHCMEEIRNFLRMSILTSTVLLRNMNKKIYVFSECVTIFSTKIGHEQAIKFIDTIR